MKKTETKLADAPVQQDFLEAPVNHPIESVPSSRAFASEPVDAVHLNPLVMIQMAIEKNVNPEQLGKLMDLQERWAKARAIEEYNAAMARVQKKMPPIVRDKMNTQTSSKYARYETLNAITKPIYSEEGFSLCWTEGAPKEGSKDVHLICDVRHRAGHIVRHEGWFGLDDAGMKGSVNKTPVQAKGSTYSYGRRYLEKFIWNLAEADEDNDGNQQTVYITADQVESIEELINQTYRTEAAMHKFLDWLKAETGAENLAEIPAAKYKWITDTVQGVQDRAKARATDMAKKG